MVIRLTPNGAAVSAWVAAISAPAGPGSCEPQAITPKPPALEMAETRWRSLTQLIAPPMMAASHAEESRAARPQPVELGARRGRGSRRRRAG